METDPEEEHGQVVEDNAYSGKRKRSNDTNSESPQSQNSIDLTGSAKETSGRDTVRRTLKKPRPHALKPGTDTTQQGITVLEYARSFLLPTFPVEILQHVMSFIDPPSLGRLMCVNRYLHSLLDSRQHLSKPSGSGSKLPYLTADHLWKCSRRAYEPGMPPPLKHKTEHEMFDLIYGKRCQMCGFLPKASSSRLSEGPWNSGPGPRGVRTIWPFKIRLCANCLKSSMLKESDFLQSQHSHLRIGLLSASFTPSLHYVMSITLAQTPLPAGLNITKYYFGPQVEDLKRNIPITQTPGDAAHELFFQELDASRQEAITDVSRLEAWELAQKAHNARLAVPFNPNSRSSASGSSVHSDNLTKSHFTTSSGGFRPPLSSRSGFDSSTLSNSLLRHDAGSYTLLRRLDHKAGHLTPSETSRPMLHSQQVGQLLHTKIPDPRPDHGSVDILKMKNEKRAEILRRCAELDPPIRADTLERLPAFHSALGALMPLEEDGWAKLKDQLLNERHALELYRTSNHSGLSYTDVMDTATIGRVATPSAEPIEEDLRKQAFRPVREKLVDFAREYVHSRYAGGFGLTYSSAPQFAADVLIYVRQRFYQNQEKEDAEFASYGQQPPDDGPNGIRTRKLRLEHMRYVFEHAIRPYTELVRKDLFLCSACDTQGRHFAFEAIIQHFASKHTDAFSRGNAVVWWKTEWPVQPPFEPEPGRDIEPPTTSYLPSTPGPLGSSEVRLHDDLDISGPSGGDLASLYPGRLPYSPSAELHERVTSIDPTRSAFGHERDAIPPAPYQPNYRRLWPRHASSEYYTLQSAANQIPVWHNLARNSGSFHPDDNLADQSYQTGAHPPFEAPRMQIQRRLGPAEELDMYQAMRPGRRVATASPGHLRESERRSLRPTNQPLERTSLHESTPYDTRAATPQILLTSSTRADSVYRPHLSEEQRAYGSPRNGSRASSARYLHDLSDQQSLPSVPTETPAYSAAERFLESFDVSEAASHVKRPSRSGSIEQFPRPISRGDTEGTSIAFDRRSNTSQPRRPTRFSSDIEHEVVQSNTAASSERHYEPYGPGSTSTMRSYWNQDSDRNLYPIRDDPYQYEQRHPGASTARIVVYDEYPASVPGRNSHEVPYYVQRPQTADRHNSSADPIYAGSRRIEQTHYMDARSERSYRIDEPRAPEIYYEDARYGQQQLVLNPETRSYYVRRPEREYMPEYRRVDYERSPHREVMYDDDDRYYEGGRPSATRGPPRYERH